ncbi:MAG TPA: NADH-quinone oxidoreductase subunit N [Bacteroidales bacterium]|nr:NADH-quinone oxidoreductase subunit N [Bacteroidales bacterium]
MNLNSFLLMRHELILIAVVLLYLASEIIGGGKNKRFSLNFAVVLFLAVTIIGFLPISTGTMFGGMYQTSPAIILMKNILNAGAFIVFLQVVSWLKKEENDNRIMEFFILIVSTLIGMNYMISAGDFLMFYLGLELATIPMAALAAYQVYNLKSAEAGIKLLLLAALSSGIMLFGISMLYGASESLYFTDLIRTMEMNSMTVLALVFIFSGLAFKISIVPFHFWTADVYEGAPMSVTSYMSVISKASAAFVLMSLLFTVFAQLKEIWTPILYITSVLTMTLGNLFAIRQRNIKRFMAFSSIAQAGFIFLGIISGTQMGMSTVIYFLAIYIFSNLAVFGVAGAIYNQTGKELIDDYAGLYKTNPALTLVMTFGLFSLAGIPPIAGFFGKFFLFTAAMESGFLWLTVIAVLNTIISLYYYLLIVKAMYITPNESPIAFFRSDFYMKMGLILATIGILVIGFIGGIHHYIYNLSFGIL